ncbi:MAG: hypothetical protein ACR2PH_02605, partial [Desulfobulbia bacterium]
IHLAASSWLVHHGFIEEGIKHAIRGNDLQQATQIVDRFRHKELEEDRWDSLERWLAMFPDKVKSNRPVLLLAQAWVCNERFHLIEFAAVIKQLEEIAKTRKVERPIFGEISFLKGVLEYYNGNSSACLESMETAEKSLPEDHHFVLGELEIYKALALQMEGEIIRALEHLDGLILKLGKESVIIRTRFIASQSLVQFISGDLYQAKEAAERFRALSAENSLLYTEAWGHYILGNVALHQFDLNTAAQNFQVVERHISVMHARAAIDALAGLALVCFFLNDFEQAFAVAERLNEFAKQTQHPQLISVARSLQARLCLLGGDEDSAEKYIRLMTRQPLLNFPFAWLELPELSNLRVHIR